MPASLGCADTRGKLKCSICPLKSRRRQTGGRTLQKPDIGIDCGDAFSLGNCKCGKPQHCEADDFSSGKEPILHRPQNLISPPLEDNLRGETSIYEVLGAHWPSSRNSGKIRRALEAAELAFETQKFRSIVFDYDGTSCSSNDNDRPPSPQIVAHIVQLLEANIVVGIASGRGGSIAEHLTEVLPSAY